MKKSKNVFQGFADTKLENLEVIDGGYFYEPTEGSGFHDEYLVTEPGETYGDANPNNSCNARDGEWRC